MVAEHFLRSAATCTALAAALTAAPAALAGKATVASADGGAAIFEYASGRLRIDAPDSEGYMVIRDGTMYVVSMQDGQPMVFNASSMMRGMARNTTQMAPSAFMADFVSMEDTGRNETVAGIEGDVYEFTYREESGKTVTEELVMSDDERAIEFRNALFSMSAIAESMATAEAIERGRELQGRFEDMDLGVLRYGREMTVTSISGEKIPAERFELPVEPMNMQDLGNMLQNMQKR